MLPIRWPPLVLMLVPTALYAVSFTIDAPTATVICGVLIAISSCYQTWKLNQVHTLVNSNFTEAKLTVQRLESALKTSNDLGIHLQQQLDARPTVVAGPVVVVPPVNAGGIP